MQLYSYWARATATTPNTDGTPSSLIAYAGSNSSPADAHTQAEQLANERAARLLLGQPVVSYTDDYPAGGVPLREHIVRRLPDSGGGQLAAITRNHYGSLVLNTACFMVLDVDAIDLHPLVPGLKWQDFVDLFRSLFRPAPPSPPPLSPQQLLEMRMAAWLQLYPEWNFRLYRTRMGFRLLVTHALLAPDSAAAQEVFAAMRTDATYVRLCRQQQCYRARLTPKPWRIGWHRPPHPFPSDTPAQEQQQQVWQQEYDARRKDFSVCELLGEYGSGSVLPALQPLIQLHDEACLGGRKLA
ncbi:hypothetical protein [Hymenobacter psychrophilus]|uniref:Uncharacterized protein n=1 Tax=Hymenobacter psychrophilus TaxID=651662 RepID=A0A1H3H4X2_9BACT|nr:hypothetical protein [Hymenobacter psychrophilus]SDY10447.1 hypothetical protein SAMN04488069_105296 [Hymenobacter psychrophilus]